MISPDLETVTLLARVRVRKFPGPPESASVGIFARDLFVSSSFAQIMVPMRFRTIPRLQVFSRVRMAC